MLDPQAGPSGRQIALAPAFVLSLLVVPQGKRKLEQYLAALMDVQSGWGRARGCGSWSPTCAHNGASLIDASLRSMRFARVGGAGRRLLLAMVLTLLAHLSPPRIDHARDFIH